MTTKNKLCVSTYIECNNLLKIETDGACLTELGKAFHRVMTLGTNDETCTVYEQTAD